jgi:outer membrane receptor protein involved in Fe transport
MSFLKRDTTRALIVIALMAVLAQCAFSQTSTTGSISGVVKDQTGASVPGATVTVTSPNLIRPQSATTASDGSYTILNLPPGKYKVTVDAGKGFAKYEADNTFVTLGSTARGDIKLQLAASTTEVTVSATASQIDVGQTTAGTSVSSDQFSYFPTARTVQNLYNIAPAVTRSGLRDASGRDRDPSVAGSSGPENNYILDGVNTADPAFGGSGANLPFEFVQEVQVMTGAYGAEYGKSTGGIFNVITKSGGNAYHGDVFAFFSPKGVVRAVKNFPFTGSAANGFSEKDLGVDLGGPIKKDKLWFFAAANPQWRTNNYLTQTFHNPAENKVTIPFYAGKVTWAINDKNTFTVSTFGDFTKVDGFLATGALTNVSGFGSSPDAFQGVQQTGGHNYSFRLNSVITPRFIAEISSGLHFQRSNIVPVSTSLAAPAIADSFAVLNGGSIQGVTQTGVKDLGVVPFGTAGITCFAADGVTPLAACNVNNNADGVSKTGFVDFVDGRGGSLQRAYLRGPGFGLYQNSVRNRYDFTAHLQNTFSKHSLKYGFEWGKNIYNNINTSSGGAITYAYTGAQGMATPDSNQTINQRVTNNMSVCTVRVSTVFCPSKTAAVLLYSAFQGGKLPANITAVQFGPITQAEAFNNPFIVRTSTRVRDFELHANTYTQVYSHYVQDDWKILKNVQLNLGLRWDYQQGYDTDGKPYIKLNQFWHDMQPRLGLIWDFTGSGKGKFNVSYARFVETPIPLDVNVRAGGGNSQTDKNFNVDTYAAPAASKITCCVNGFGASNLGADATPIDPGLRPQTVEEYTAGVEFSPAQNFVLGVRGVYRNYVNIIEDGSFDDGNTYFLFNPGRRVGNLETTEDKACADPTIGCFGPARRYYRGLEFTATKRFSQNYQFIASYTFSSLVGNYEGLFRNDNGQSDPNITSLFDLVSLLGNTYGRLPNDRPQQFKFNGSYQTPWKLMVSGNFYAQSGSPFNQLIPHPVYGNNEGFQVQRGTAIVPTVTATQAGFPNLVDSVGSNRTPTTTNVDLGFSYPVKVGEGKEVKLAADWFNVFNVQRAVTLDQTFSLNSGVAGVPAVQNPYYGSALLVQAPSQWRFGVKFSF